MHDRIDTIDEGPAIQQYLAEKTGQRTVPNIFISASPGISHHASWVITDHVSAHPTDQKHIGGADTLVSLQSQGKLAGIIGA